MCLIALALERHPRFRLVLAANRDEYLDRPAAPLDWWSSGDGTRILSGRDLRAGGTWLGLSPGGRVAMLTNIRRPGAQQAGAPSRGCIVPQWLAGADAAAFCATLGEAGHNPFNLIAGDLQRGDLFWVGSDQPVPQALAPGFHGLSNAALDTPWPKLQRLKAALRKAVTRHDEPEALAAELFEALADRHRPDDRDLPHTGVPLEWERRLAPVFIVAPGYGTRCSTVLLHEHGGRTLLIERSHLPQDGTMERRAVLDGMPLATT